VLFFLVGLGWSFHVTFTLMTLLQSSQPDLKSQGILFSAAVIYCMNLLVILLTATLLSQTLRVMALGETVTRDCVTAYGWTLDNFLALWHYAASLLNH
jgi:positive regulator of sigma E activity